MEAGSLVILEVISPSVSSRAVAPGSVKSCPRLKSMVLSPLRAIWGFWVSLFVLPELLLLELLDELLLELFDKLSDELSVELSDKSVVGLLDKLSEGEFAFPPPPQP